MPELRRNPLNGDWVIVAPERAARPDTFRQADDGDGPDGTDDLCPFCPGNEGMTPPEVARTGDGEPETPGWRVRVVPNLYPIVNGNPVDVAATFSRFHDAVRAGGAHEVIVLSPDHDRSLADLTGVEVEELFDVLAQRVNAHIAAGHAYVQILVNHGRSAGASIEHPHTQLVAVGVPPPAGMAEAERITAAPECPVCRAVGEDADGAAPLFVAASPAPIWCPWWSGVPFEVMVAPRAHEPRFEHAAEPGAIARSLGHALALLRRALGDVPYNLVLHSSPHADGPVVKGRDFHWHAHIWPRLVTQAGFEQGTGFLVNQVPPEHAAAALRAAGRTGE